MRIKAIAARLRKVAFGLETLAARQGDVDLPEKMVPAFILNVVTDENLAMHLSNRPNETPDIPNATSVTYISEAANGGRKEASHVGGGSEDFKSCEGVMGQIQSGKGQEGKGIANRWC